MRYIRLFENYSIIESKCNFYNIEDYSINNDLTIDVGMNNNFGVHIQNNNLEELPLNFRDVHGDFNCSINKLKDLKGCPLNVFGNFRAIDNSIDTLKYFPKYIEINANLTGNSLTSLEGISKDIGYGILLAKNKIESLEYIQNTVSGNFYIENNNIKTLKYFPKVDMTISIRNNPLPKEILDNKSVVKGIIKLQYEYNIWNYDDTLNINRFNLLLSELY